MRVDGILFDKDGTLFDFGTTWNTWTAEMIPKLAEGDMAVARRLADELDFDLDAGEFLPHSIIIAGTNRDAAEAIVRAMPHKNLTEVENALMYSAAEAPLSPAVPLEPFLRNLGEHGLRLGVMTNDTEYSARAHLSGAGVDTLFDLILGFDSGHGAKPDPEPLLAFSNQFALDPTRVAMVGDSTHDLVAGRRAGMQTIAVLTGVAGEEELTPYADVVFPNIGYIADWLKS
ncbi:phosphoglycolate phosphatase [Shimia gijangensis]|uniref:phosphoglycolate phosphatase n=1 Tax=Shimia gijangensis TaxID=1470563 RepID=A0A1M6LK16_9RHOB|nr:HAD family hydrolase [Shimia gijangensis]SHJ71478.1 phosphoglycolate phosphatase [Shimia gijangensis]